MEKYFVNYKQALALKELGFDEPCLKTMLDFDITYESNVKMPLKSQVFEWFRKEYGYWSYIKEAIKGSCRFYVEKFDEKFFTSDVIDSYEEAESACIDKLIEIVKGQR